MAETKERPPIERAAILLMMLSPAEASKVMKYLSPKQIQSLGQVMTNLKDVDKESMQKIVSDFIERADNQTHLGIDNAIHVREVLANTIGEDKADSILDDALMQANNKGLESLKWMDPKSIFDFVHLEHPQIQAIVLSYLDPDQAAEVLMCFDEQSQLDLIMRISNQESIDTEAISELNEIIIDQYANRTTTKPKILGGIRKAADIMNYVDTNVETEIFDAMRDKDNDLAIEIQELMFVFDNIKSIDDKGIQTLLREVSTESLVVALKGADPAIKDKVIKNMSKRAATLLIDDLDAKGPVKLSDVEKAQKEILSIAKKLSDAGEISLGGKGEEFV